MKVTKGRSYCWTPRSLPVVPPNEGSPSEELAPLCHYPTIWEMLLELEAIKNSSQGHCPTMSGVGSFAVCTVVMLPQFLSSKLSCVHRNPLPVLPPPLTWCCLPQCSRKHHQD